VRPVGDDTISPLNVAPANATMRGAKKTTNRRRAPRFAVAANDAGRVSILLLVPAMSHSSFRSFLVFVAAAAAVGCSSGDKTPSSPAAPNVTRQIIAVGTHGRPRFLPLGVPMPDTGRYSLGPKPYEAGDPLPRESNLPNVVDVMGPPGHQSSPRPQTVVFTDAYRGWNILAGSGISASFDVAEDPVISGSVPSQWVFYAPTALPYGKGCLEVTNFNSWMPPGKALGVFNFCLSTPAWITQIPLNGPNGAAIRSCCIRNYTDAYDGTARALFH